SAERQARLQRGRAFGIGRPRWPPLAADPQGRGCSSGVEHDLDKVGVEGSNPFARSSLRSSGASTGKPVCKRRLSAEALAKADEFFKTQPPVRRACADRL